MAGICSKVVSSVPLGNFLGHLLYTSYLPLFGYAEDSKLPTCVLGPWDSVGRGIPEIMIQRRGSHLCLVRSTSLTMFLPNLLWLLKNIFKVYRRIFLKYIYCTVILDYTGSLIMFQVQYSLAK